MPEQHFYSLLYVALGLMMIEDGDDGAGLTIEDAVKYKKIL